MLSQCALNTPFSVLVRLDTLPIKFTSDFASVLHPAMRMTQFSDRSKWSAEVERRARALMRDEFDAYAGVYGSSTAQAQSAPAQKTANAKAGPSLFARTIKCTTPTEPIRSELERFYDMSQYPWSKDADPLEWFKVSICLNFHYVLHL